jgi:polyvinyl alcohol dehydrogenase (cytochrome)
VRLSKPWPLFSLSALLSLSAACGSGSAPSPDPSGTATQGLAASSLFDCSGADDNWPMFGQNVCGTRTNPSNGDGLRPATASKLAVKWAFKAAGDITATPAVVGNDIFVPDWAGMLNKIDARSGKLVWSVNISTLLGLGGAPAGANDTPAGITSRDTPIVTDGSVIFGVVQGGNGAPQPLAIVAAVDRKTGALKWQTLVDPHPAGVITGSPMLDHGKVYVGVSSIEEVFAAYPVIAGIPYTCCSFRGSVVALDADTGNVDWKTYTIDDSAYFQSDGVTPSGFAGAAVWSAPAIDRGRGSLYVTTGNNYSAPPGTASLPDGDHVESILSLDLKTGAIKWAQRMTMGDVFTILNVFEGGGGPDYDFGSGPNLFHAKIGGRQHDAVGAGQKSGMYWAVDADTGNVLWNTAVGPGGTLGGIHWGTASDNQRVYVDVNDQAGSSYVLGGSGPTSGQSVTTGSWAALDQSTGSIEWQVADPALSAPLGLVTLNGPVSTANGVLFGGSMDAQGTMFALDGSTGAVLWSFPSGGTVYGGPAIANGVVYWGNGYPAARLGFGTPGGTLYAFQVAN